MSKKAFLKKVNRNLKEEKSLSLKLLLNLKKLEEEIALLEEQDTMDVLEQ